MTPVYVNFTILPCLPGFVLLGDPPGCSCHHELINLNITCQITDGVGYFSWTGSLWVNIDGTGLVYNEHCPHNYCNKGSDQIDLQNRSDELCDINRTGQLCGKCKETLLWLLDLPVASIAPTTTT